MRCRPDGEGNARQHPCPPQAHDRGGHSGCCSRRAGVHRDALFKTPCGAADLIRFRSADGWTEWKTKTDVSLNDATQRGVEQRAEQPADTVT